MAERIDGATFAARVLGADVPVLVDFYSDTCVPCKRLVPQLARLETAEGSDLAVVKVNTQYDFELAERYGVMSTPTLVLFGGGEELGRVSGFHRAEELQEFVAGLVEAPQEGGAR